MTHYIRLVSIIFIFFCLFSGCKHSPTEDDDHNHTNADSHDDHDKDDHDIDDHEEHVDMIVDNHDDEELVVNLTPAELDEFHIEIAIAERQLIETTTVLPGEVVMNPNTVAHVVARASGITRHVFKMIGDTVSTGEPLVVLESSALAEVKAAYLSRLRENELARTDLLRAETVYKNTHKLLEFLIQSPSLDALNEFADLDLGANRNALVSAYVQLVTKEATYILESSLFEKNISSEVEYMEAESVFKQAQAAYLSVRDDLRFSNARTLDQQRRKEKVSEVALLAAQRNLHAHGLSEEEVASISLQTHEELARYEIGSPLNGVIIARHIVRGELIDQGGDIFTIADLGKVWVLLSVYQKDLPYVRSGQLVEIVARHGIGQTQGTIQYISPVINETTRTTTARIVLANPDGAWRPGLFVTGRVVTGAIEVPVAVPLTAIQTISDDSIIFVRTDHGFEPRVVELGLANGTKVEIVSGLNTGEEYVAVGGFALKAEMNKASFEHAGHAH